MPKGVRQPGSLPENKDLGASLAKPRRKRLNNVERRQLKAAALQLFVKEYGRKAHAGYDPNDRHYDKRTQRRLRHIQPQELDELLRDGED
ncbi:MAG TPA: hypothetical protein VM689_10830 [Aliidongia sp.]|nr:hypothetical protein [Aliidongia sp.]